MKKQISMLITVFSLILPLWQGSAAVQTVTPPPVWLAEGHAENAYLGQRVTSGDFNGDGYADLAAIATLWDTGEVGEGAVFVWHGSASGLGNTGNPANADWIYETNQMNAPYTDLTTGDLNGDGYDDLVVSSAQYTQGESSEGAVFVWLGSPSGLGSSIAWMAQANLEYGYLGQSLAVGDLNGDGYGDLAVGAATYPRGADWGEVFVWQGSTSGLGDNGTPANADWKFTVTPEQFDNLGYQVAFGDVNSDGYEDLAIGSPCFENGQTDEGAVFVFHGSASGPGSDGTSANADWMAEANQVGAYFGQSLAFGDVNGDGFADLGVAARFYDHDQTDEGAVFVWQGAASGLGENGIPTNADWMAQSNQADAYFDTLALGDGNGDGYADLAMGAWAYDQGEIDEGAVFVWQGSASGLGPNGIPANASWSASANQANAQFGHSLTFADTDGNGLAELLVGAPGYTNGQGYEGAVLLFAPSYPNPHRIYLPLVTNRFQTPTLNQR